MRLRLFVTFCEDKNVINIGVFLPHFERKGVKDA